MGKISMAMTHQNLCDHAEDTKALYQLWDDDLRKTMHRRQFRESAGILCFFASFIAWKAGIETFWVFFVVLVGLSLMFSAMKFMIEESNINYLMHQWDLQNALGYFRKIDKSGRA
jgi:hypothetical protein